MTPRPLWLALRRPLLVAAIYGCAVSLMTAGRLTLRLAGPATIYWSFVPLVDIAGLAAIWRARRSELTLPRAIDAFFLGNLPWCLWITAFAAIWAFLPTPMVFRWTARPQIWIWYGTAGAAAIWSAVIDYRLFRAAWPKPVRALILQRAITWTLGLAWFLAPSAISEIPKWLGRG